MQRFAGFLVVSSGLALAAFQACTAEKDAPSNTSAAAVSVGPSTGTGSEACFGNFPDGFCALLSAEPETCECPDCTQTAGCTGKCKDDGNCDTAGGEDCTCADCYGKDMDCMFDTSDQATTNNSTSTTSGGGMGGMGGMGGGATSSSTSSNGGGGAPADAGKG